MRQSTYEELAKQLGIDAKVLQEKLPQIAKELQKSPDISAYDRANAAFVATNLCGSRAAGAGSGG
ncbi:MAG: hypothetical protein WDM76_05430 [Limisphaerales bacterium]